MKPRYPKLDFDRLQIYYSNPLTIDIEGVLGTVTVKAPSIGDIIEIGESRFYSNLSILVGNTTQYRLLLWNQGIDWNTISDFQMFMGMYEQLDKDVVDLLFDNINFEDFHVYVRTHEDGTKEEFLYNEETETEINEVVYQYFHQYFQNIFNMKPEEEITRDKHLKEWWIRKDTVAIEQKGKKHEESSFSFVPLISLYVNYSGTKYSSKELKEVGVPEFFDSIARILQIERARAVMSGMYSGFVNSKDIDPSLYDLTKDI